MPLPAKLFDMSSILFLVAPRSTPTTRFVLPTCFMRLKWSTTLRRTSGWITTFWTAFDSMDELISDQLFQSNQHANNNEFVNVTTTTRTTTKANRLISINRKKTSRIISHFNNEYESACVSNEKANMNISKLYACIRTKMCNVSFRFSFKFKLVTSKLYKRFIYMQREKSLT